MKLTRRTFLKFAAALAPAPLVARDMGDFDFLDTPGMPREAVKPVAPQVLKPKLVSMPAVTGDMRYNTTMSLLEIYDGKQWRIIK